MPADILHTRPASLFRQSLIAAAAVLVFFGLWFVFTYVLSILLFPLLRGASTTTLHPVSGVFIEISQLLPVVGATFLLSRFDRRPLLAYGFQGRARAVRFLSGLACGFVALSALVLCLWQLGYLAFDGFALAAVPALRDAALWAVVFLLGALFEESFLRGYPQFTLTRGLGFWWSALLLSTVFAFGHSINGGESLLGLVAVASVALVFSLSLWYTGSLWWAVGFHAAWDWGQSYFYGTADSGLSSTGHLLRSHPAGSILLSGGATGPEGSVLIFPLLGFIALFMVFWWGRRIRSPFAGAAWHPVSPSPGPAPAPIPPSL